MSDAHENQVGFPERKEYQSIGFLRRKAAQCRRLASEIRSTDPAKIALEALAAEYDERVVQVEIERGLQPLIGSLPHSKIDSVPLSGCPYADVDMLDPEPKPRS